MTKIGIASDHAGYEMKEFLVGYLSAMGYDVIIVFPARFITNDEAVAMLDAYFGAQFEGGRHQHRIEKMAVPCGVAAEK